MTDHVEYDVLDDVNSSPNGWRRGAKTGTIRLRFGQGTGIVEYDTPLDEIIWAKFVTGGLYEVDDDGMPVPTEGRPLAFQPEYDDVNGAAWHDYAVSTHAMSEDEAGAQTEEALRRRLHMNPNKSAC